MYLETGLAEPRQKRSTKPPPKTPVLSRPRLVPADQLLDASIKWGLKIPFRKDFQAFVQEVAKAIGRHIIRNARDITKADDWILKRDENRQRLKTIHDDLTRVKRDSDIVILRTRFNYIRSHNDPEIFSSEVKILGV